MNVALFGFMGVGKSVIGRILADKLGYSFIDIDEEIVSKTGRAISTIFETRGEATFRDIERSVTCKVSAMENQIIACGGGTVLDNDNLESLRGNSAMILLTAEPEIILERVKAEGDTRPLLPVENRLERIHGLLSVRHPKYIRAADYVVDTSNSTPEQVADEILNYLMGVRSK